MSYRTFSFSTSANIAFLSSLVSNEQFIACILFLTVANTTSLSFLKFSDAYCNACP